MTEYFKNEREFYHKYPSRIYECSYCKRITANPYYCTQCGRQANQLFSRDTHKIKIGNNPEEEIFKPIELEKG